MNIFDHYKLITKGIERPEVIEIGAADGADTQRLLEITPKARITCFEPDPRNIEKFVKRKLPVLLYDKAVGNTNGTTTLHLSEGKHPDPSSSPVHTFSNSILRPKEHLRLQPWCKFNKTIEVEIIMLDSWLIDRTIDFIWCDIQGAEGEMIQGARQTLRCTRYLYIEYSNEELYECQPNKGDLLDMLPDWDVIEDFGTDLLLKNRKIE